MRLRLVLISMLLTVSLSITASGQRRKPEKREVEGHTLYTLLKPGDIPAIFDPQFIPAKDAGDYYFDDEPLLVVVDGDKARGYSTWHLDHHEIVNDVINGKPIAVTW